MEFLGMEQGGLLLVMDQIQSLIQIMVLIGLDQQELLFLLLVMEFLGMELNGSLLDFTKHIHLHIHLMVLVGLVDTERIFFIMDKILLGTEQCGLRLVMDQIQSHIQMMVLLGLD